MRSFLLYASKQWWSSQSELGRKRGICIASNSRIMKLCGLHLQQFKFWPESESNFTPNPTLLRVELPSEPNLPNPTYRIQLKSDSNSESNVTPNRTEPRIRPAKLLTTSS